MKNSSVDPNAPPPTEVAAIGAPPLGSAEADFGAYSVLLAIRSLAKNLRAVPGRKMVILFSSGFPLTAERQSELTATIDACNKANVAVYPVDARGLTAPTMNRGSLVRPQHRLGKGPGAVQSARLRPWRDFTRQAARVQLVGYPQRPPPGGGGGVEGEAA
ncbi:MAG: hypothetical protein DMG33_16715, partial [Acidobacteria bacterium]